MVTTGSVVSFAVCLVENITWLLQSSYICSLVCGLNNDASGSIWFIWTTHGQHLLSTFSEADLFNSCKISITYILLSPHFTGWKTETWRAEITCQSSNGRSWTLIPGLIPLFNRVSWLCFPDLPQEGIGAVTAGDLLPFCLAIVSS